MSDTVATVADLAARHIGQQVRIHRGKVDVTARLIAIREAPRHLEGCVTLEMEAGHLGSGEIVCGLSVAAYLT